MKPIAIVGAGAVSAAGLGRQAIAEALRAPDSLFSRCSRLAATHPDVEAAEVPRAAEDADPTPARNRDRMSRAARLAAIATRGALTDARWSDDREGIGFFLGVGGSGGSISEIEAILGASLEDGRLSLPRMGRDGLAVSNPLYTFSTLHNFTLCTSAMLEGTGGPNAAFFSRGAGTLLALAEAAQALADGDCVRTLAGGADTALHPVTWAELALGGAAADGLIPAEGAAVLALGDGPRPIAMLEQHALNPDAGAIRSAPSHVLLSPWGEPARRRLNALARERFPDAERIDLGARLGEALAAQPALAWVTGVELVARREATRVLVLSQGLDDDGGAVVIGAPS